MEAGAREGKAEQVLFSRARDFLRGFSGGFSADEAADAGGGDSDEIELGLSLGGCFSSRDMESNRLLRSSSIPAVLPSEFPLVVPLVRACSLPSETEEEIRRKELQSLKRMEAKRKREEKRNNKRVGDRSEESLEMCSATKIRRFELGNGSCWVPANGVLSPGLPRWITGASMPAASSICLAPPSRCSAVSQGSSSSGGSELDSRQGQGIVVSGFSCSSEVRSPARVLTVVEPNSSKASSSPPSASPTARHLNGTSISNGIVGTENIFRENEGGSSSNCMDELCGKMMVEMPSVSTMGVGPNGRRVEGFLYNYKRGEEVRIVCVCHGKFLTPAEFVKHAGGGDVANPLRHIVVNPKPSSFL